mgnify:CR=1 FL=1
MRRLFTPLISLIFLFSCSEEEKKLERPSEPITSTTYKAKMDSVLNAKVKEDEPGIVVLVAFDGEVLFAEGFGMRNVEKGEKLTPTSNMRMASVSKQFTALCMLTLVNEGKISLDDEASDYLPYPIFEGIKVEQLLNHTSGLPDYYRYFEDKKEEFEVIENQDVLDWLATGPEPVFPPGEGWEYSNTAYLMAALIVEKVSGQEFSAYAKENVFKPSGMASTNYFNLASPVDIPERSLCYQKNPLGSFAAGDGFFMNGVMGDGAVYTSAKDYFRYDQTLRNKALLSEELHDFIFQPSSEYEEDGEKEQYGMGWGVSENSASHTGGWIGTNTYTKRFLDKPLTIALFANRDDFFEMGLIGQTEKLTLWYLEDQNLISN